MSVPLTRKSASGRAFCPRRLERVFADCFLAEFNTRLVGGAPEPLYEPAWGTGQCHRLHYRADYFASALHEAAHWCIAGPRRRRLTDFGYWYVPEGRSAAQQRAFEAVEYRPQALEWHFARACGYRFQISADNLDSVAGGIVDDAAFKTRIVAQASHWLAVGLPLRADRFVRALRREFAGSGGTSKFTLAELG